MFNFKQIFGMITGNYPCENCGKPMEFEDEDALVCPYCGYSVDLDDYGTTQEERDSMYPTREEVMGYDDDDEDDEDSCGEVYEEVYGELDDD